VNPPLPLISKHNLCTSVLLFLCLLSQQKAYSKPYTLQSDSLSKTKILYIFTGSDWCPNCIKFKRKIFSDSTFARELQNMKIKIEIIDFPQHNTLDDQTLKYNQTMADKLNFDGIFPTFTLSNPDHLKYKNFYFNNENTTEFIIQIKQMLVQLNE